MAAARISDLGYALLGLVAEKECSGYDLRRIFSDTPMARFSDSPGAIYPALRRLEHQGLIRGRTQTSAGIRRKRVFRLTPQGDTELRRWLERPVSREDVTRRVDQLMLRFSYMDQALGSRATLRLLQGMERELAGYLAVLHAAKESMTTTMPLSARLALDRGVRDYESWHEWTIAAIRVYRNRRRKAQ